MKKLSTFLLMVALSALLTIGGTLAYEAQGETLSESNPASSAQDLISQSIITRGGSEVSGSSREILYPAVYSDAFLSVPKYTSYTVKELNLSLWDPSAIKNEVDRIVLVENISNEPVFFRTIFAFESYEGFEPETKLILNTNCSDFSWSKWYKGVTINGKRYDVIVAVYKKPLSGGDQAQPSLLQVALSSSSGNRESAEFGWDYEIMVKTQAVTTDKNSLDNAFGELNQNTIPAVFQ